MKTQVTKLQLENNLAVKDFIMFSSIHKRQQKKRLPGKGSPHASLSSRELRQINFGVSAKGLALEAFSMEMQVLLTAPLTRSRKLNNAQVQLGKTVSFSAFCMVKQNSLFANQIVNLLWWTQGDCQQGRRTDLPWQLHVGRCLILAGAGSTYCSAPSDGNPNGMSLKPSQRAKQVIHCSFAYAHFKGLHHRFVAQRFYYTQRLLCV